MNVDLPTICELARTVGWYGDDVATVAALAWAATGGDTAYRFRYGLPGTGDLRGLWAVDVDRWPSPDDDRLHDASVAAKRVRELTAACGGFSWAHPWRTGRYVAALPAARTAATQTLHRPKLAAPTPAAYAFDDIATVRRRVAPNRARLAAPRRTGRR